MGQRDPYEDLIEDLVNIAATMIQKLGISRETSASVAPSFHELHATVPWFFRRGKSGAWCHEMPPHLQELFMEKHGDTLLRLGYSESRSGLIHHRTQVEPAPLRSQQC
jgi:hypothetical protein